MDILLKKSILCAFLIEILLLIVFYAKNYRMKTIMTILGILRE